MPNQRVATEYTATVAISSITFSRKNAISPHTSAFHARPARLPRSLRGFIALTGCAPGGLCFGGHAGAA